MKTKPTTAQIIDLVQKFCITHDEPERKWMKKPFYIDHKLCATDASHVIQIDGGHYAMSTSECPFGAANFMRSLLVDSDTVIGTFPVTHLTEVIAALPHEDEFMTTGICAECKGEGEVEWEYEGENQTHTADFECPKCHGQGEFRRKTGKLRLSDYARVRVGDQVFDARRLALLQDVATVFDATDIEIKATQCPGTLFKLYDALVLILPMEGAEADAEITVSPTQDQKQ